MCTHTHTHTHTHTNMWPPPLSPPRARSHTPHSTHTCTHTHTHISGWAGSHPPFTAIDPRMRAHTHILPHLLRLALTLLLLTLTLLLALLSLLRTALGGGLLRCVCVCVCTQAPTRAQQQAHTPFLPAFLTRIECKRAHSHTLADPLAFLAASFSRLRLAASFFLASCE